MHSTNGVGPIPVWYIVLRTGTRRQDHPAVRCLRIRAKMIGNPNPKMIALLPVALLASAQGHSCYYYVVHVNDCSPSNASAGFDACMACAVAHNSSLAARCLPGEIELACHGEMPPSPSPPAPSPPAAGDMVLTLLHDAVNETGARCLDGSSPGYYFRPGAGANNGSWLLVFQGGGWCRDAADCAAPCRFAEAFSGHPDPARPA